MIKRYRRSIQMMTLMIIMFVITAAFSHSIVSNAEVSTQCTTYDGDNIEDQNYRIYTKPIKSYLTSCSDGTLMRFQAGADSDEYLIEYYDKEYNLRRTVMVSEELPVFGAFYETDSNYYILSGQNNPEESDDKEVYRITQYDKNWNRLASCGLNGANTTVPFDAGSARMTDNGRYLLIRTCHEMYESSDGKNHQANVTIQVDMSSMTITDSYYKIMNSRYGYISHSFNQFIQTEGNNIVAVDHGDANPRSIVLIKYVTDFTTGKFAPDYYTSCTVTDLVSIDGEKGANYTGVSIGGFEISDTAYLVAGNQDINASNTSGGRNIFVAAQNKSSGEIEINYITDYAEASVACSASTPHLVKLSSDSYLLMWSKEDVTYYTKIDEAGKKSGDTYSVAGNLSDCVPIVSGGKVIWYTWDDGTVTFYDISTADISVNNKTEIVNGHKFTYGKPDKDYVVTCMCDVCGHIEKMYVPKGFTAYWKRDGENFYYSTYKSQYDKGYELGYMIIYEMPDMPDESMEQNQELEVISSDEEVVKVSKTSDALIMGKPGIAAVTIKVKYNPSLCKKYEFRVGSEGEIDINECSIVLDNEGYSYTGNAQTPNPDITYNGITLVKDKDYVLSGENNTNPGKATLNITGKGIFGGTVQKTFTIKKGTLEDCFIKLSQDSFTYNGYVKNPSVSVVNSGDAAIASSLYNVQYSNNLNAGTAKVTVTGTADMPGTLTKEYTILPCDLSECSLALYTDSSYYVYSGAEHAAFRIIYNNQGWSINKTDLSITYENNINAGTATVTVRPKAGNTNIIGSISKTWEIAPLDITDFDFSFAEETFSYNGKEIKPEMIISNGTHSVDINGCTVEYANNINAGTATVTVTGKENYTGSITKQYEIAKCDMSSCTIELSQNSYNYDGTQKQPEVTVKNGEYIIPSSQYTLKYSNNINIGAATVTVTGKDNCTGTANVGYSITPPSVESCAGKLSRSVYTYDGTAKKPEITITDGEYTLEEGVDYTCLYSDNINAGTAKLTVTGIGNFIGERVYTFTINPADIDEYGIVLEKATVTYNGAAQRPSLSVVSGSKVLIQGTDYTLQYKDNTNIGTATVIVTGTGNYTGSISETFEIERIDISDATVGFGDASYEYTGDEIKPLPTVKVNGKALTAGTDYNCSYSNNVAVGNGKVTITGNGIYKGEAIGTFAIAASDISGSSYQIHLSDSIYTYDGTEKIPEVILVRNDITQLQEGTDYTLAYSNNVKAGTAKVTLTGKGNFKGTRTSTYIISRKDISGYEIELDTYEYDYDGNEKCPMVTFAGDNSLTAGMDYTVSYKNNKNAGTATAVVTGIGNYAGTIEKSFTIKRENEYCDVTYAAEEQGMKLTWNDVGCGKYYIYRKENDSEWVLLHILESVASASYVDTTALAGHSYSYAVCAAWQAGEPAVPDNNYTGSGTPRVYLKCCSVSSLTNKASGVQIKWNKVSGASGYIVYRKIGNARSWSRIKVVTGVNKISYTDTAVKKKNGTTCRYMVTAFAGNSAKPTGVSTYKEKQIRRLTAPKLLSARFKGSKTAKAVWRRNSKSTGYQIQYSVRRSFKGSKKTITVKGSRKTTQTIRRLRKNKRYYVRVRAYYKKGSTKYYSAWSNIKGFKTK